MLQQAYKEGTIFAIPLRNGGYAIGVVARIAPREKIVLAYLFGPARKTVPLADEVRNLHPQEALRVARVGDLSLLDNTWPIIGQHSVWERDEWPMRLFVRREEITKKAWLVKYSDLDANEIEAEEPVDYSRATEFERDAVLGAGAAEIIMTKIFMKYL